MLSDDVRAIALLLPNVVQGAHQGHADFRVGGRIFATLWSEEDRVVVRLPPSQQAELIEEDPDRIQAVPGGWGSRGWTNVDFTDLDEEVLRSVLLAAWSHVAPPNLVAFHRDA